jgi:hypothetical protein
MMVGAFVCCNGLLGRSSAELMSGISKLASSNVSLDRAGAKVQSNHCGWLLMRVEFHGIFARRAASRTPPSCYRQALM